MIEGGGESGGDLAQAVEDLVRITRWNQAREKDALTHAPLGHSYRLAPADEHLAGSATGEAHHAMTSVAFESPAVDDDRLLDKGG